MPQQQQKFSRKEFVSYIRYWKLQCSPILTSSPPPPPATSWLIILFCLKIYKFGIMSKEIGYYNYYGLNLAPNFFSSKMLYHFPVDFLVIVCLTSQYSDVLDDPVFGCPLYVSQSEDLFFVLCRFYLSLVICGLLPEFDL